MKRDSRTHPVHRRRVFYIPGYDPFHPRRYRELYRTESAKQAKITGYDIEVSPKPDGANYGWKAVTSIDNHSAIAEIDVLVWSDIVRDSMKTNIASTYIQLVLTAWTYITSGALRRMMWMRKGPVIAALYPIGMLLLQLLVAVLIAAIPTKLLSLATPYVLGVAVWLGAKIGLGPDGFYTIGMIVGGGLALISWVIWLGVIVLFLRWFKSKDNKLYAYYLMHDYAFTAQHRGAIPRELEVRMAEFADEVSTALSEGWDEVLIVGHSSGAHIGISIVADILRAGRVSPDGPRLSLLTLGQVVPMVSFLPEAYRLRSDLAYMAAQDQVAWVDVTAPGDGCSFALCDPVGVSGVTPKDQRWPLVISAAFTQSLSPERWHELRWRFFRLHFQYLCAFDRPKDYDYFQITAGPMTLADRYRDRKSSQSRIDVPASKHTALAP